MLAFAFSANLHAQVAQDEKAEALLKRAVEKLGGERYLQVKTIVGTGYFTMYREGVADMPNTFLDVISLPNKERTEFKANGTRTVQTNSGETGWLFDTDSKIIKIQGKEEVDDFKRSLRTSLDYLLRGNWRGEGAKLTHGGKREAGLGKRNEVVKLLYSDGLTVEFEFSATDGLPMKSMYIRKKTEGEEIKEEDRYAQFVEVNGVFTPFIIDKFRNGIQISRINYLTVEFNKNVSDAIFIKPNDAKDLKKDLKL